MTQQKRKSRGESGRQIPHALGLTEEHTSPEWEKVAYKIHHYRHFQLDRLRHEKAREGENTDMRPISTDGCNPSIHGQRNRRSEGYHSKSNSS